MDINLSKIGLLPVMPAQPVRINPACRDSGNSLEAGHLAPGKQREQSVTEGITSREDIQPSDNIARGTRISEKEPEKEGFENVLRRQLRPNESNRAKIAEKSQETDVFAQNSVPQQSISVQNGLTALIDQNKPTEGLNQESNQTKPIIGQTVSQPTEPSLKDAMSAAVGGQGKDAQGNLLQQTAVASTQTKSEGVLLATAEAASVQQGEQQKQEASVSVKQTAGNTSTIKPRATDEVGLSKTAESAVQHKTPVDAESVNFIARQGSVQTKTQPAVLSADTASGNGVVSRIQEQVSAGGQQGVAEATNNVSVKDKAGNDSQKASKQLAGDGQGTDGFSGKLNIEKVELSSGIINTPKSESGNNPAQSSPAQIAGFGSVITNSPVIEAGSAKASANVPVQDAAASVREQIYQSVKTSIQQGTSEITIRLNPPELGQVSVKFSEQGNELTGVLEATNPQTRAEIRQAIPEIIRSLEESGVSIKRIEVTLSSDSPRQSAQQSLRDNASQNPWEQLGQHSFQDIYCNRPSHESYITPTYSGDTPEVRGVASASFNRNQSLSSDNLLDVLI